MSVASKEPVKAKVVLDLDATALVWLAETADGIREVEFKLVKDKSGKPQLRDIAKPLEEGDETDLEIKVKTKRSLKKPGATRIPMQKVTCQAENCEAIELACAKGYDAVFWTESAVEKFLYPYYHSQRLWDEELEALKSKYECDEKAVAIAHQAPSRSFIKQGRPSDSLAIGRVVQGPDLIPVMKWVTVSKYTEPE